MKLPKDFTLGVATAAYQIEGTSFGKCEPSHWDHFAATGGTYQRQNGDIACAHYQCWADDLDLIAAGGFDAYRFSVAWPRIAADATQGLDFYDRLVDGLLDRGIAPHITLYHWDLPLKLAEKGGWKNPDIAKWFTEYALKVTDRLGDRLASIATINEPWCVAWLSHFLGHHAPGKTNLGAAAKAMHNVLFAHGMATSAMRDAGHKNLGIVLNMEYAQAASDATADQRAARIYDGIYNRWFIEAITKGRYPNDIFPYLEPHLPKNHADQMGLIQTPIDWLGLNYYTRSIHADDGTGVFPYHRAVTGPLPKTSMNWEIYPEGLTYFLKRLHSEYTSDLPLFVTENGMAQHDQISAGLVNDTARVAYIQDHIQAALVARNQGVPVQGYFAWSLLDNFEWAFGYAERFGIVHVDFESQKRTPKASFKALQSMIAAR